jgi:hypothetical protein
MILNLLDVVGNSTIDSNTRRLFECYSMHITRFRSVTYCCIGYMYLYNCLPINKIVRRKKGGVLVLLPNTSSRRLVSVIGRSFSDIELESIKLLYILLYQK